MSNFSEQQRTKTETREKDRVRREKLAGYLYNLSQLTFAAWVLGGVTPLFVNLGSLTTSWPIVPLGAIASYSFATTANRILK